MKTSFKSFFGVSGKEVSGFLLLCSVLLVILLMLNLTSFWGKIDNNVQEKDQAILDSLLVLLENKDRISDVMFEKFSFDPNSISSDSLILLGFNKASASQIVNFRKKGGQFRYKNDLYKIYSIDSVHLGTLMDLIQLPDKPVITYKPENHKAISRESSAPQTPSPINEPLPRFNINTADTAMLQTIRGIGSVLSKRIVTFRSKLGGFVSLDQLYEVYNLDSTVVSTIMDQVYLDEGFRPVSIDINTMNAEDLSYHPYISRNQARLIQAYREQHGSFNTKTDLGKVYLMDSITINKLLPYISW